MLDKQSATMAVDIAEYLYLTGTEDIYRSGFFSKAVRRRMRDDGLTPNHLQNRLIDALDAGATQDGLLETSNKYELDSFLADELNQ